MEIFLPASAQRRQKPTVGRNFAAAGTEVAVVVVVVGEKSFEARRARKLSWEEFSS